jgi:Flp pilus assembly protein TadD
MYKAFLFLVLLLSVVPSDRAQAQAAPSKSDSKVMLPSNEPKSEAKSLYDDGIERLEMGQVSEALERFQKAVKIDPEYAEAYSALGRTFFKLKQWENAVGPLRRAMELKAKERERQDTLQKDHPKRLY